MGVKGQQWRKKMMVMTVVSRSTGSVGRFQKERALIMVWGVNCILIDGLIVPFMSDRYCGNILTMRVNKVPFTSLLFWF